MLIVRIAASQIPICRDAVMRRQTGSSRRNYEVRLWFFKREQLV